MLLSKKYKTDGENISDDWMAVSWFWCFWGQEESSYNFIQPNANSICMIQDIWNSSGKVSDAFL